MIKLGTYKNIEPSYSHKERLAKAGRYANSAYSEGVKQIGWPGYIVIKNKSNTWDEYINIYHYVSHPIGSYLACYLITDSGLVKQ